MIRDTAKALERLELVTFEIERAIEKSEAISMSKACERAKVSQSFIYYLIDNIENIKIADEYIDRFYYAQFLIKDVLIQELDKVEEVPTKMKLENGEAIEIEDDNSYAIARANLKFKKDSFKLKTLMPKTYGDRHIIVNDNSVTDNRQQLALLTQLNTEQLKQLASQRLIDMSNTNE